MVGEFERLAADGVTDRELARVRGQIRGAMVLGGEDSLARMGRLGRGEVVTGRLRSMEENLRLLDAVTGEEVRELAEWLVSQERARVLVGRRSERRWTDLEPECDRSRGGSGPISAGGARGERPQPVQHPRNRSSRLMA